MGQGERHELTRDAPERYGPWQTLYERFAPWSADGTWRRIHQALLTELQRQRLIDWSLCCVDGSSVRALSAAAGARKKTWRTRGATQRREPRDHALGRSRAAGAVRAISSATGAAWCSPSA
jgi:hypothetical protein